MDGEEGAGRPHLVCRPNIARACVARAVRPHSTNYLVFRANSADRLSASLRVSGHDSNSDVIPPGLSIYRGDILRFRRFGARVVGRLSPAFILAFIHSFISSFRSFLNHFHFSYSHT